MGRFQERVSDFQRDEAAGLSESTAVDNKVGEPVKLVPDAATLFKQLSGGAYGELLTGELGVSIQTHVSPIVLHDDFEQKDQFFLWVCF